MGEIAFSLSGTIAIEGTFNIIVTFAICSIQWDALFSGANIMVCIRSSVNPRAPWR
jgi:hypothetical protein